MNNNAMRFVVLNNACPVYLKRVQLLDCNPDHNLDGNPDRDLDNFCSVRPCSTDFGKIQLFIQLGIFLQIKLWKLLG